jgi:hypothetical protein
MTHYEQAIKALEEADRIANTDSTAYGDDRQFFVANYIARAQVHATLALADATQIGRA